MTPQRQGLEPLQQVEGRLRIEAGAEVAEPFEPRLEDEGGRTVVLGKGDAVVAGAGLGHDGEAAGSRPVELAAVDQDAAQGDAVAADELGRRVHHDVRTEIDRPGQERGGEGAVDHERHADVVGEPGDGGNVQHVDARVADRLAEEQLRVRPRRALEVPGVGRFDEGGLDAEAPQGVVQQVVGAAVDRGRGHDVVAGRENCRRGEVERGLAGGGGDRADAAFERRDSFLEDGDRRVRDPRVDVPGFFEIEQPRGVVRVAEHVGRRVVDRHRARPGGGVGPLTGVKRKSVELVEPVTAHGVCLPVACCLRADRECSRTFWRAGLKVFMVWQSGASEGKQMGVVEEWHECLDRGEVLLLDGATGTELERRGVPMDSAAWCGTAALDHQDAIRDVHDEYIRAGARCDHREHLRDPPAVA